MSRGSNDIVVYACCFVFRVFVWVRLQLKTMMLPFDECNSNNVSDVNLLNQRNSIEDTRLCQCASDRVLGHSIFVVGPHDCLVVLGSTEGGAPDFRTRLMPVALPKIPNNPGRKCFFEGTTWYNPTVSVPRKTS